jgi:hypothetical protein
MSAKAEAKQARKNAVDAAQRAYILRHDSGMDPEANARIYTAALARIEAQS